MSRHRRGVADLVAGALMGAVVVAWSAWTFADGAGLTTASLSSLLPGLGGSRQVASGDALMLPVWVRGALLAGLAAAGGLVLAGVGHEARRRFATAASTTASSDRARSIPALVMGVATGTFFALVGSVMALAAAGAIPFEDGSTPDLPWFLGGIGAFVVLASLLVTYASLSRWWRGDDAARGGRQAR